MNTHNIEILNQVFAGVRTQVISRLFERAWRAMGGQRLITYTLQTESGASLRGAGWRIVGQTKPVKDGWRKDDHLNDRRTHSPVMLKVKNRWQMDAETRNGKALQPAVSKIS